MLAGRIKRDLAKPYLIENQQYSMNYKCN